MFEAQTPQQLEIYNAATAAGIPAAGIRLFIASERSHFSTDPESGRVFYDGVPITAALKSNPEITASYKVPERLRMTISEFTSEQLAGRIPLRELSSVQIVNNDRTPITSAPMRPAQQPVATPPINAMGLREFVELQQSGNLTLAEMGAITINGD